MNENGWILLSRKIIDWQWFDKSEMVKFWLYLLLSANAEDKKWHGIEIKRGQLVTSVQHLTEALHLTTQQVRTALKRLQDGGEIEIKTTNQFTLITICNYRTYQDYGPTQQQTNNKPITNEQQTNNKPITTTKQIYIDDVVVVESAKQKNFFSTQPGTDAQTSAPTETEKEKSSAQKEKEFTPPTEEQVRQYCLMAGLTDVNAALFVANYNENGWTTTGGRPVKNWQALAVKWNARAKEYKFKNSNSNGNLNNRQERATRHASCEPRTDVSADEF